MTDINKRIYWPYVVAAYVSLFALGFLDNFRSPYFYDVIKDLNLSDSVSSLFFIIPSVFGFIGGQLCNLNIHRVQPLWGLRIGLCALASGVFLLSGMSSLTELILACTAFGFGLGIVGVFEHACVYQGSTSESRRRLLAGLHAIYAGSALCAPLVVKFLAESMGWGWRNGFLYAAGLPFLMIFILSFIKKPKQLKQESEERPALAKRAPRKYFFNFVYTSLISALYVSSEIIISTRLPLYLRRVYEFSLPLSSQYLFYFFILMFCGRSFFIIYPLKQLSTKQLIVSSLSLSLISFIVGLKLNPMGLVLCGLLMSPCFALFIEYISEVFEEYAEHAMGFTMVMGTLVTAPMHFFAGFITEHYGIKAALNIGPICIVMCLSMLYFRKKIFKDIH